MLAKTLLSRAILQRSLLKNVTNNLNQTKRHAGHGVWTYRMPPPMPSKKSLLLSNLLGGFAWWWILWHCFTEPEHIFGEWPYVDPSTYTDEELGIPPDSAGRLKK